MAQQSYQNFPEDTDDSDVHVIRLPPIPPTSKTTKWSHIEDLDLFFTRIYTYHQKHGFMCVLLKDFLELVKVLFILVFSVFLIYFVDYDMLFRNKLPKNGTDSNVKTTLADCVCPLNKCIGNISGFCWMCIIVVLLYWFFRVIKLIYTLYYSYDIKRFYNNALKIADDNLINFTWHEVEKRICEAQVEYKMCIRKDELTELDIYHRILRSKNYMVAMINKSILPIHHNLPKMGTVAYLSQGLKYNIELLLFSGTWGFFENWHLKEDYKKSYKRQELAAILQRNITWFAIGNLILGPFIFLWQLVYFFFNYAELLKREPGMLALRCWSLYGRLYLRHFNELDHELDARLKRAYRPAAKYMNTFSSPVMTIVADFVIFIAGAVTIVLCSLIIWDEDVMHVEHVITIDAVGVAIFAAFKGFIPDENQSYNPESLTWEMLKEVHYLPDTWRGRYHTTFVRDQFSQFFQYKATYLLFELLSPIVTPLIFYFKLRPRSLEIIDFYRNFTVSILGVGDVCSFSLLDIRRHGNPAWNTPDYVKGPENNKQTQAEDGKTELSLIHFAKMNPTWHPPEDAERFIHEVQERAYEEESENVGHLKAFESVGSSIIRPASAHFSKGNHSRGHRLENPMASSSYYFNPTFGNNDSFHRSADEEAAFRGSYTDPEMSISTLYLHRLHHKKLMSNQDTSSEPQSSQGTGSFSINAGQSTTSIGSRIFGRNNDRTSEGTPLLKNVKPA